MIHTVRFESADASTKSMADKIIIQLRQGLIFIHDSIEREGTQGIN